MNSNVSKIAKISLLENNEAELEKINKFTLAPVAEDEIYVFKILVADNEQELDRDFEPLMLSALKDLASKLIGKTMIIDHSPSAHNQIARIYDTYLETSERQTEAGEPSTELIAKCYMVKTQSNADLIAEINGGIKKEVSVGFLCTKFRCNICGKEGSYDYRCNHKRGKVYSGKTCRNQLCNCTDAYEVSFVAVPCQPKAGTTKSYDNEDSELKAKNSVRIRLMKKFFKS